MDKDLKKVGRAKSHIINALYTRHQIADDNQGVTVRWASGWLLYLLLFAGLGLWPKAAIAAKGLFISSYHQGYNWSDGVERGVRATLGNQCELRQFDMDTKRYKAPSDIEQKALQ
ncbi:hypothetical protein [Candidatus Entotheonella palauensis]|uniref:hypothetical protein n=1 Tax=Candidatus Entotheonella palauensis TaxID=93172 RepID=UPI000B7C5796|nr:hypothetical protein [Candidatus Entotheonella palauensis]